MEKNRYALANAKANLDSALFNIRRLHDEVYRGTWGTADIENRLKIAVRDVEKASVVLGVIISEL